MQETQSKLTEKDIIRSIMKKVVAGLFDSHLTKIPSNSIIDLEKEISRSTEQLCLIASASMLALLSEGYPELFPKKMILKCIGVESKRFKADSEWRWHAVAIVQSKNGTWYAFSPANLGSYGASYNGIIESNSLQTLIESLEAQEGGVWTLNSEEIQKIEFEEFIPSFYTTILNRVIDMDQESILAAVDAYNNALDTKSQSINQDVIQRLANRVKKM